MIALIGHGYVAKHIACELEGQGLEYVWITHRDPVTQCTAIFIFLLTFRLFEYNI